MKHILIKYRFKSGSRDEWHREIERFISALDNDPELSGKISYRSTRGKEGDDYYHFVEVVDDQAVKTLQERDFFSSYTEKCERVAGGEVEVLPLEIIAETKADIT